VVGQVFFYLPVVSAAALLRPAGAALVTACAVAGEAVVVLSLLPVAVALTDLAFVGTTLLVTAGALARAGVLQDRLVEELRRRAAVDDLTGLLTRRVLDEATDSAVAAARSLTGTGTGTGTGTAFLLVDVDRFKQVNDHHGHLAGDEALRHVAGIVREHSRPHDVAARMGGDEIAVLLPGCSYPSALRRAQEVVDAVRRRPLRLPDGTVLALSVSVGAAHAPEHAASARDLYARADAALYAVKRTGRGRAGGVPVPPAPPGPAAEEARTRSAAR
jgi:diguanylate cyclase (GGDEF)-like protein